MFKVVCYLVVLLQNVLRKLNVHKCGDWVLCLIYIVLVCYSNLNLFFKDHMRSWVCVQVKCEDNLKKTSQDASDGRCPVENAYIQRLLYTGTDFLPNQISKAKITFQCK